jgi:uncharacterized protein
MCLQSNSRRNFSLNFELTKPLQFQTVIHQSKYLFHLALERFEERQDKGYSLTDCLSMVVMETHGIGEILTTDAHFRQAGFRLIP